MFLIPWRKTRGQKLTALDLNTLIESSNRLSKIRAGRGIVFENNMVHHKKDCFYATIEALGPDSEADYADERYWLKEQYVSNSSGSSTVAVTFADKTDGLHVTATNIAEITGGTHNLSADTYIKVYIVRDVQTPQVVRYIFDREP